MTQISRICLSLTFRSSPPRFELWPPPAAVYSNIEAAMGTRLRLFAVQLVIAAAAVPANPDVVAAARAALTNEANNLLEVHRGLIYGDPMRDLKGDRGDRESGVSFIFCVRMFNCRVPRKINWSWLFVHFLLLCAPSGSLYISAERQQLLFGEGCLRTQKACRSSSDPYYPATNYGLDAMVKHVVEQAQLLANDPLASLTPTNERFQFLWDVGPSDLFDAQATSVKLYEEESTTPAAVAQWLQIAVLPCLFAGKVIFLTKFFRPWVQRTLHETKRVAECAHQRPA